MQYTAEDLLNFQDVVNASLKKSLEGWRKNNLLTWRKETLDNIEKVDRARRQLWNRICSSDAVALNMDEAVVAFVKNLYLRQALVEFLFSKDKEEEKNAKKPVKKERGKEPVVGTKMEEIPNVGGMTILELNRSAVDQKRGESV